MDENLSDLIQSFDKCLKMLGSDSNYDLYDKDAALAMTFILMERKIFDKQDRRTLSIKLTEKYLDRKNIPENFAKQLSEDASFLYNACYYPNTIKYLVKYGVLNSETLRFVLDKLNYEVRHGGVSSSMSACMSNIQGKAASVKVIQGCINLIET